jgi:hypothetical protein
MIISQFNINLWPFECFYQVIRRFINFAKEPSLRCIKIFVSFYHEKLSLIDDITKHLIQQRPEDPRAKRGL